ncbi:vitellogenin 3, phosvitinless [Nematolebias whitei]|uniref:vitellogenin 3, phosvitinless n=1 Tax=Nematolebias whitei TaxID=451745 RepID=UPI00189ABCBC|nr:vitellogenin 3, phosvitinless [Nematolebias whitei]
MRGLLLCCLLALATCQNLRYDLTLNPKKTYEYRYEGVVNFKVNRANFAESGVKITCKARITGVSGQTFLLQLSDLGFAEYNGFPEKNDYEPSPKLVKRIAAQLVKPFKFEYTNGHVSDILASAEISNTVVNIVRGILEFFQVTVKTTHTIYELEEFGLHGKCQSNYAIEEDTKTNDWTVTQVVDVTNCREKAEMFRGMAHAMDDKLSEERGVSVFSTVRYVYTVKPSAEGGLITRAHGLEQQHFSPFNVKGGTFKMQAMKELTLLSVSDTVSTITPGPMESKGDIVYKFEDVDVHMPIVMQNLDNPIPKAVELIKHLAEANMHMIDNASTDDIIKVYQLMKVIPTEGLESMWKQFADSPEYRRWFLDLSVETGDAKILKFLEKRFQARDLTLTEAWQTFLLALQHLQTTPELVEMAKIFLRMPYSKSYTYLWHTVVLSYGSLVYRHCEYHTPCPMTAVQPLLDMATDALRRNDREEMVLALKALGNAGHPGSIKTIMRFLPGVAATPVDLPAFVQSAAVQAMRLITVRDPHSVQDITMNLFLQKHLQSEIRMLALMVLFDTKPSMALVSTVTTHLMEEKDLDVGSFAYSYLRGFARSWTPDNHFISIASSVAVKILAPKFGRLSYFYSKARRVDWFDDDFLTGLTSEFFMLKRANNIIPSKIMSKGKFHMIGRIIQLMEFGICADGIKELFGTSIPGFKGNYTFQDLQTIFKVLQTWEKMPDDKPVLSAYSRASGQEWFFADISKETIRNIITVLNLSAEKTSLLWAAIEHLQKGTSWNYRRPFLILEARYFQATTLGLPVEISKYYNTLSAVTVNSKASINPPLTDHLGQLLNSEVSLETDGFAGFSKDFWVFYGISTDLFQCGFESKNKMPVVVPWKFTAKINVAEKKFELDFPPCKEEIELFSLRYDVYAVFRNIEEPTSPRKTSLMLISDEATEEMTEVLNRNTWYPFHNMSTEGDVYGVGLCAEYSLKRQYYREDYPLYYFLGYANMSLKIVPVETVKPVDKIHFELDAGPSRHPMSTRQLLKTLRKLSKEASNRINLSSDSASRQRESYRRNYDVMMESATPEAVFNLKAFAMRENEKPEGYDVAMYYTPEAHAQNVQVIMSQVGDDTNWKMCLDTSIEADAEAKAHIRWGAECQSYDMSVKADVGQLNDSKPALRAKAHWTMIPEYMTKMGKRIERYIPGMAFLYGFYQEHEENDKQEVSASVVAASPNTIHVKVKFPEYTVFYNNMSFPIPYEGWEHLRNMTNPTMN